MASATRIVSFLPSIIRHQLKISQVTQITRNRSLLHQYRRYLWINHHASQNENNNQTNTHQESRSVLYLSDTCVKQLLSFADSSDTMLRVTVEGGGCSGFQYKFNLDTKINNDDKIFEKDGARVVIDDLSLSYLSGSTIDYHQEMIRSSFRITNNPHMEMGCSCGVSFSLK